jgi:ribose transport system permease protein
VSDVTHTGSAGGGARSAESGAPSEDATASPAGPERGVRGLAAVRGRLIGANILWIFLILVALLVFFSVIEPNFTNPVNLRSIAADNAPLLVLAVGMTYVIVSAGIDLSVGSVLIFSGVVAAKTMLWLGGGSDPSLGAANAGWGVTLAGCAAGILGGTAWGLLNGFFVAKARIPALIATLGTLGMALGASYLMTGGTDVRGIPLHFARTVGFGLALGAVPWLVVIAVAIASVFGLVLAFTRFGLRTYAIGSHAEGARRVGIPVEAHLIRVYALSGMLAGVAGCLSLAHFTTTTISGHTADNLSVIAAVVLGGASLFGGSGTVAGTVIGLLIPAVLQSGFVTIRVNPYWQYIAVGAVLVLAVYFDQTKRRNRV